MSTTKLLYKIIQGDCVKALPMIENDSIDLIFADPPYNISKTDNDNVAWKGSGYTSYKGDWDIIAKDEYKVFTDKWVKECYRVLRPGGGFAVIGIFGSLIPVFQTLRECDMRFQSHIIWHKTNPAPCVHRRMLTNANEIILYFTKGKNWTFNYERSKKYNNGKQLHNVWNLSVARRISTITVKPIKLMEMIVRIFSMKGDLVLDPFLGSGTTMEACQNYIRNCIGIEISPEYCEIAKNRCFDKNIRNLDVIYDYNVI